MTLTDFLLARIAEDETVAQDVAAERVRVGEKIDYPFEGEDRSFWADYDGAAPSVSVGAHRVLAECQAKRRIVELHESWPVLAQGPVEFDPEMAAGDAQTVTFRASQRLAWMTNREYVERFGEEAPTAPILALLALPYADHADFQEAWRV